MSNIATLGLEFTTQGAENKIEKLCKAFDELSKKSESVQEIFNSISGIKALNNTFVVQFASIADSLTKIKGIDASVSNNINSITSALSGVQPVSGAATTSISAFANSLKNIKLDANTNQSLHNISSMMGSLRPVSPEVSTSLHNFVASINGIQPVSPAVMQSLQSLNNVLQTMSSSSGLADLSEVQKALSKFDGIKPEVAVSIRELFNTFKDVKGVDGGVIDSIAKLGDATGKFKAVNATVVTSLEQLFSAIGGNIPQVNASKTQAIAKLGEATSKFKAIQPSVVTSVEQLFQTLTNIGNIKYNTVDTVARLGESLSKFKAIKPEVAASVKNLFDTLNKLQPISVTLRISIQMLTDMFNAMAAAGKNASTATKTLGNSMGYTQTQTDGLSIAFRTLQGAVSFNFFKSAAAQAVEFGTELAYIQSIASELDVSQIGTGVMNMSSVLGNASESLKGLYYAYSSGIRGSEEDFLKFTETMRKTAIVNRSSFIPTIDAATAAMNAYNISVDRAGEVADTFFAIVKYGKASGEQLANSLGQVTPTAKTLGVSLDELGASIASLTKIQPTRVAITGLNNMLSKIMKPTKESRLALQKLGVDMSYSAVQSKGFVAVLEEVREALNGDAEAIKNIFPDIRGQRAAMHLLGAGWKDFNEQLKNFENKKGSMEDAFETVRKNTAVQLGAIPETMKKIVTEAGTMITKFVTLGGVLTPVIAAFNNMSEGTRKFFAAITLVVGGYAAYKAAMFALQSLQAIQLKNEAAIAAAQTAKLAQLREEVILRKQLAGLAGGTAFSSANTVLGVGKTRVGFAKGFAAMFKPIRLANMSLKRFSIILRGTFAKAVTYAGAILGKVATVITTVFSAANMIIAGIVAIGAIGIDYAINGVEKSVTTDAIEGIYNWWTGAADKAKKMDEYIQRTRTNLQAVRDAKDEFENFDRSIYGWYKSAILGKSEAEKAKDATETICNQVIEFKKNHTSWKQALVAKEKATQEEIALGRSEENARKNQISTAQKVWEYTKAYYGFFSGQSGISINAVKNLKKAYNNDKMLAEATTKREEASKRVADASGDVSKYSELSTKNLQNIKKAYEDQRNLLASQIENLKTMKSIFDAQQLKEYWGDNKIGLAKEEFTQNIARFNEEIIKGETKGMLKALKAAAKNYNTIRDTATKIGKEMAQVQVEAMLMGAKNNSQKKSIYDSESNKALSEMKNALASGNISAASKSLKEYTKNAQKSVAIQNKLAEAERQANQKTLQMILALDKFKVTAMDFIDINSTEAMKLQSRSFGSLPQFTPLTTQQESAQAANDKLANTIAEYSKKIAEFANKEKTAAESEWQKLYNENKQKIANLQNELQTFKKKAQTLLKNAITNEVNNNKKQTEEQKKKNEDNTKNIATMAEAMLKVEQQLRKGIEVTNFRGKHA